MYVFFNVIPKGMKDCYIRGMNKINSELRQQAIALGLCEQWQGEWKSTWKPEELVERFFRGINFCVKNHYPNKDFLTKNFDKKFLRSNNIVVDDEYSILNPQQALITGASKSNIRFNGLSSGRIHIQGDSSVKLNAKNRSNVIAHIWDNAQIEIQIEDMANVLVIRHSKEALVIANDNIPVKDRF